MATTHSWDSNQRLVDVSFKRDKGCQLIAHVPNEPNLAPPGWYMLFITSEKDVPSIAKWVHLRTNA
jgi:Galactose oxidase-like, Early set domain